MGAPWGYWMDWGYGGYLAQLLLPPLSLSLRVRQLAAQLRLTRFRQLLLLRSLCHLGLGIGQQQEWG